MRHVHVPTSPRIPRLTALVLLAALLPLALSSPAWSGERHLGKAELRRYFEDIVRAAHPRADEIRIDHFTCSPEKVSLPVTGESGYSVISHNRAGLGGRETIVLALLVDGREQDRVRLGGDVAVLGPVIKAARSLPRHTVITAADIVTVRADTTMLGPGFMSEAGAVIGKELRTTLRPGAIFYQRLLKKPELVRRGDMVTILAQGSGLRVSVPGMILGSGAQGDLVRVKNMMSRREVYARVVDSDTVRVDF